MERHEKDYSNQGDARIRRPRFLEVIIIDQVGDGSIPTDNDGFIVIKGIRSTPSLQEAFDFAFPNINDDKASADAAIVATLNATVDEINNYALSQLPTRS